MGCVKESLATRLRRHLFVVALGLVMPWIVGACGSEASQSPETPADGDAVGDVETLGPAADGEVGSDDGALAETDDWQGTDPDYYYDGDYYDENCHIDCFGSYTCEDGVVSAWGHYPIPCYVWYGYDYTDCPNEPIFKCPGACAGEGWYLEPWEDPCAYCAPLEAGEEGEYEYYTYYDFYGYYDGKPCEVVTGESDTADGSPDASDGDAEMEIGPDTEASDIGPEGPPDSAAEGALETG